MPKQLISVVGLIVSLGIVALAVVLIAMPMWMQSISVDAQTMTVKGTNELYQSQVETLQAEQERQEEIEASVAALRTEIPAINQLDDVFEVVSRAADSAGVTITSATAGENSAFVTRTTPSVPGDPTTAPPPPAEDTGEAADGETGAGDSPEASAETPAEGEAPSDGSATAPLQGRQQIDFEIAVTASDMSQVTAFLDALRDGPRLLSSVTATANQTGTAIDVRVTALTFLDSEG